MCLIIFHFFLVAHTSLLMDDDRTEIINNTLQECFYGKSDFHQFYYLVTGEGVNVNIKHSETQLNALMIAAINGLPDVIETLLKMGADPKIVGILLIDILIGKVD